MQMKIKNMGRKASPRKSFWEMSDRRSATGMLEGLAYAEEI